MEHGLNDVVHAKVQSSADINIITRLEVCAEDLVQWNKNHRNNLKKEIEECRKKLTPLS